MRMRAEYVFGVKETSGGLALLCEDKHGWAEQVRKDVWSPVYGKKDAITVLNFGTVADLPAEFVTLLIPLEEVGDTRGKLTQIRVEQATPVRAYRYSTSMEECSLFFAEAGRPWTHGSLGSDAEFVCRHRKDEGRELLIFCRGSYVVIDGRRVLSCKRTISHCEMLSRNGRTEIHASEPDAAVLEEQLTTTGPEEKLER